MGTLLDKCAYCLMIMVRCLERDYILKAGTNQAYLTRYSSYLANNVLSKGFLGALRSRQGVDPTGQVCILLIDDGQVP